MAQSAGFMSQDNRTDMGIPVFWTTAQSDSPWNFKIWFDQFLLAVTVKENKNPEILMKDPKPILEDRFQDQKRHKQMKMRKQLQIGKLETSRRETEFC